MLAFLFAELGTSGAIDGSNQLIMKGNSAINKKNILFCQKKEKQEKREKDLRKRKTKERERPKREKDQRERKTKERERSKRGR